MNPLRRRWFFSLIALALLGALGTGAWQHWKAQNVFPLPAKPSVETWPAAFVSRLASTDAAARQGDQKSLEVLSRLYHANGFYPQAVDCYKTLIATEPQNALWPHLLSLIDASYGQLDQAIPLEVQVTRLDPAYLPAKLRLAEAYAKTNRPDAAEKLYQQVLQSDEKNIYALRGLALLKIARAEWPSANNLLRRALTIRPNFTGALTLLVTVQEQLGDKAGATSTAKTSADAPRFRDFEDPWEIELLDDCYDTNRLTVAAAIEGSQGNAKKAEALLSRAIDCKPQDDSLHRMLGQLLDQTESFPEAERELRQALTLAPREPKNFLQLAMLQAHTGNEAAAERTLRDGVAIAPNDGQIRFEHGSLLLSMERLGEAISELREAEKLRPEKAEVHFALAGALIKSNRGDEATAELKRTLEIEPDNPPALLTLARVSVLRGDEAFARELYGRIIKQKSVPEDAQERLRDLFQKRFGHAP